MHTANRYHDISTGHRVYGHESKCKYLHGHNYRVHFECSAGLDSLGRVIDFSVIKEKLCMWLEDNWDHKFLLYCEGPLLAVLEKEDPESVVSVPFNPTAENMAQYLVEVIAPKQLEGTGVKVLKVVIDETRKCSASYATS
jgi:6-pyruvoyltetrahydropterin/6-carboxytetrahydropterin synthase